MGEVIEKKENINVSDYIIEAGDLANEVGKKLMKDLYASIERHASLNIPKLYFLTSIKKDPTNLQQIHLYIKVMSRQLHYLRENFSLWEFDYGNEKLKLLWSIPHRTEMKNFLREPSKYSPDLIKWIKMYLKQEKINLHDKSCKIIENK